MLVIQAGHKETIRVYGPCVITVISSGVRTAPVGVEAHSTVHITHDKIDTITPESTNNPDAVASPAK